MTVASRLGRRSVVALGGLCLAAALFTLRQPGPGGDRGRPSIVLASVPAPPPRPSCSLLAEIGTEASPRLAGFALAGGGLDAFLRIYGGAARVGREITAVNPAFCPVLDAIAPFVNYQPEGPLRLRIEARIQIGTTIRPMPQAPEGSTIALDLFNAKGAVVHLLSASSPSGQATWTATSPAGQWLAVTIASRRPLLALRPATEPASSYLGELSTALRETRDAMVTAVQIDVVAPVPREQAPYRPECEKVSGINERAQTGGELSDADRAILRTCHR